jgi:hypothetical protein
MMGYLCIRPVFMEICPEVYVFHADCNDFCLKGLGVRLHSLLCLIEVSPEGIELDLLLVVVVIDLWQEGVNELLVHGLSLA